MFDFVLAVWNDFWHQSPIEKIGFLLAILGVSAASFLPTRLRLGKTRMALAGLEARVEQLKLENEKEKNLKKKLKWKY